MSFLDLFSEKSHLYAAARPKYPDELFTFIASLATPNTVWDCGAGNGQAALSLARHFTHVFATDASAEQIANAFPHERITYSVQPAEATDFLDQSFDAICTAQALHWFNHAAFAREIQRVAKPNAIFAAWGYDWFQIDPAFDAHFKRTVLAPIQPFWPAQAKLLWDGYANVPLPIDRIKSPPFQIEETWNLYQLLAYVHTWSGTRAYVAAHSLESAEVELAGLWGSPEEVKPVVMPLHVVVGKVQ